jgi:hypothetical protein
MSGSSALRVALRKSLHGFRHCGKQSFGRLQGDIDVQIDAEPVEDGPIPRTALRGGATDFLVVPTVALPLLLALVQVIGNLLANVALLVNAGSC